MNAVHWATAWRSVLGLSSDANEIAVVFGALIFTSIFLILPAGIAIAFLERKLAADFQARVGPNRAGPSGAFQPFADFLKLLQKEGLRQSSRMENLWLWVYSTALFATLAILPLGNSALLLDTDMSAFLAFWILNLAALAMLLMGLSQRSVPGWLGSFRAASQALAASFPALLTLLAAGLRSGGFSWTALFAAQGFFPFSWTALSSPFGLVSYLIYIVSGMLLVGVAPFDSSLQPMDLNGGVSAPLQGQRLSLFRFSRSYAFFLWVYLGTAIFLGGGALPSVLSDRLIEGDSWRLLKLLEGLVSLLKTGFIILLIGWVGKVNPRVRADQATDLSWKILSPLALMSLVGLAAWMRWVAS